MRRPRASVIRLKSALGGAFRGDDGEGGGKCRLAVEARGVEYHRIGRRRQRRDGAIAVAVVTLARLLEDAGVVDVATLGEKLVGAAAGAHFRRGGDEDLHRRIGADHRADVAAVENGAGLAGGEGTLEGDEGVPDLRVDGDARGELAGLAAAQVVALQVVGIEVASELAGEIG
jgi:hypothetical protein